MFPSPFGSMAEVMPQMRQGWGGDQRWGQAPAPQAPITQTGFGSTASAPQAPQAAPPPHMGQGASNLGFGSSNPYLDKSVEDSLGDTTRAYNMTTAPAYTSAQVRSGSFGNSGLAQMQGESERQLQTSLGRQANDMRSGNYQFDQQFDRAVYNDTFGQNQQQFQNGLNLIGMQQGANTQNLGLGTQIQNTPMNYYQGFANTANGIGQGFGTATESSNAQGSPLMGAFGGWQLGGQMGKRGGGGGGYNSGGASWGDYSGSAVSNPFNWTNGD